MSDLRIGIFLPYGTLDTVPSVRDGIKLLAHEGYIVDIYCINNSAYPQSLFNNPSVFIVADKPFIFKNAYIPLPAWTFGRAGKIYRRMYEWFVLGVYGSLWRNLFFKKWLLKRHKEKPYACLIGCDVEGLAVAKEYSDFLHRPFVYWALEMLFCEEIDNSHDMRLKKMELQNSKQAALVIIQDRWRASLLIKENDIEPEKIVLVPNAPYGKARRSKGNYLHKKFNISRDTKIVLFAGSFDSWTMAQEIAESVNSWPEEFVLVMHCRQNLKNPPRWVENMTQAINQRRLIISTTPLLSSEYFALVDSADIGVAFYKYPDESQKAYKNLGKNIKFMGFSSGKISDYLQRGLPIIINDVIGPDELIKEYKCGIRATHPNMIFESLLIISSQYDGYSANACRCFDERLELGGFFKSAIQRINELSIR